MPAESDVYTNHIVQVMSASLEYLGQNAESVLHILRKQDSLRKGYLFFVKNKKETWAITQPSL